MTTPPPEADQPPARIRMTAAQRRQQLVDVGRALFAEHGFDATTVEMISATAGVSKPVVYEHFGGKEGLYAVVCDRELAHLGERVAAALSGTGSRRRIEQAALALLTYMEDRTEGFRILVRESAPGAGTSSYSTLLNDAVASVAYILEDEFVHRGFPSEASGLYAQALVGAVSSTALWWLDTRGASKEEVAAHMVNLVFNGLVNLDEDPKLITLTEPDPELRPGDPRT